MTSRSSATRVRRRIAAPRGAAAGGALRGTRTRPARYALRRGGWVAVALLTLLAGLAPAHATLAPGGAAQPSAPAASPGPAVSPSAGALEATRKVQARYDATRSFSAAFGQEMRLEAGGQVLRSAGQVSFQRPGKMRWSYVEPEPQEIVADGETLWIYQPQDHQVLKTPLRNAFESRTPVSFLLGVARIEEDFAPVLLDPAADGSVRLKLVPLADPEGALGALTLEVDPVTFDIRAAIIGDSLGNTTRVGLRDLRRNEPIDAEVFRFVPPYGADVVESPSR